MKIVRSLLLLAALAVNAEVIEAESGRLTPGMAKIETHDGASGGRIVRLTGRLVLKIEDVKTDPAQFVIPFTVPNKGAWGITLFYCAEDNGRDSVYFRIDGGELQKKSTGQTAKPAPIDLGDFVLDKGAHTLEFFRREPNFGLDRIEIRPVDRRPRVFSVKGQTGTVQTYSVSGAPGTYFIRVYASAPKMGPQYDAKITIGKERPIKRRIISPVDREGRYVVDRVRLGDEPTDIRFEIDPEVTIDRLEFRPAERRLPPAADAYVPKIVPRPDRPRVLLNKDPLPEIRRRTTRGPGIAAWQTIRKNALRPFKFVVPADREVMWNAGLVTAMRDKAFYYLLTGDEKIAREACELAVAYFKVVNFGNAQDICRRTGESIQAASIVYDWCYPVMTDQERAILRDRFLWQAETMEIGWPPFRQPINVGHGDEWQLHRDLLSMAIAVYDEDPVPWRYCVYRLVEEHSPMKNHLYKSGYLYEGSAYGNTRFGANMIGANIFTRATGVNLFGPHVAKVGYAWFYLRTPDGRVFSDGDDYSQRNPYPGSPNIYLWSNALWPDPKLKSAYMQFFPDSEHPYGDPLAYLLFMDPDQPVDDRREDLPPVKYFGEPLSLLLARTGWNMGIASDDVLVEMIGAGIYNRGHQHLDAGAFQLYCRGQLAADLGQYRYYGRPYDWNFNKTSIAHSVLRLVDPEQKTTRMGKNVQITSGIQEGSPYGPATLEEQEKRREFFSRGDVLSVSTDPRTPHLQVDLTRSYPNRAKKYVRTTVFLAAEKPALVVYDEVETARPAVTPVWQITTFGNPVEKAGKLVADRPHLGLPSRLTVTTLLPRKTAKKILSGKAAHTVEGVYYPAPYPELPHPHGSRTEITAAPGESGTRFLHVLQPTPGTEPAPVEMTEKDGVITLASDGWTLELAPGKPPKATVAKPFKTAPPPRDMVYLDGKPVEKIADGKVSLTALLQAKGVRFTDRDGKLVFGDVTLADGKTSEFLEYGQTASRDGGRWPVPANCAGGLLNAETTVDRYTGSMFLVSRAGTTLILSSTVTGGSPAEWRVLLEKGLGSYACQGRTTVTAGIRKTTVMDGVRIKFLYGDQRKSKLRIEVSADGKSFETVFDGMSSGKNAEFETFAFPARKVRIVRITFDGTSQGRWNTILGVGFSLAK